ncbi:MAG: hypothetical protein ACREUF_00340, partial [Solimonas sp.]
GVPSSPSANEVQTEVRSNSIISVPTPPDVHLSYAVGHVVIEWSFRVPRAQFRAFVSFLADNEAMIAASCEKLMKGVHYRGTFLVTDLSRGEFRTYWAYDSDTDEKPWEAPLGDGRSNFTKAVQRLRSYWLRDPDATDRHMAAGALLGPKTLGPFFKFTLDTAEAIAGGGDPGTPRAARKSGRR